MKLRSLLFVAPVIVALAAALLIGAGVNKPKSHDHTHMQQKGNMPPLLANGVDNPAAIPDIIAYEILFNSITTAPVTGEAERKVAQGLAKKMNLDDAKTELIRQSANDFKSRISAFDQQALELKDRHWPKPAPAVMNQLDALQKQKEGILNGIIKSLPERLGAEDAQKLLQHIDDIKKKVKVFQEVPIEAFQHH